MSETREEYLAFAKARALEYVDRGEGTLATTSFLNDVTQQPGTVGPELIRLTLELLLGGHLADPEAARRHIEGFN